jgi:uncharacterized protein
MSRFKAIVVTFLALVSTHVLAADVAAGAARPLEISAEDMNRIGIRYATGSGVPQDLVAALAWYERAAQRGSASAMNNIATMHYHGLGVPQSYEEAVKWLRLAVKQGNAPAQNKLGSMYHDGLGVPQSAHDAFELFNLAAAQGYAPGMANLGLAYASGSGVKRDDIRGYALISAAIEIGLARGEREAALYQLGALSQRLNAREVERAQSDARTLLELRSSQQSAEQDDARDARSAYHL